MYSLALSCHNISLLNYLDIIPQSICVQDYFCGKRGGGWGVRQSTFTQVSVGMLLKVCPKRAFSWIRANFPPDRNPPPIDSLCHTTHWVYFSYTIQCSILTVVLVPETTKNSAGLPDATKTSV